jgi:DNA-binding transcriptional ArsR family regulator
MRIEANIAPVAALFAEPSRAAILSVLLDGRALPAGELANLAGVSPTAASAHLTKLIGGGLLAVEIEGRHRYYRLANAGVAQVIEELALLTKEPAIFRTPPLPRAARALRQARSCYDHLAGELAVAIAAALESRGWLVRGEGKRYEIGNEEGRQCLPARESISKRSNPVGTVWPDNVWTGLSVARIWLDLSARVYSRIGVNAAGSSATIVTLAW